MLCFGFLLVCLSLCPFVHLFLLVQCPMFIFSLPDTFPLPATPVMSAMACFHLTNHLHHTPLLKNPAQKPCIMIGSSGGDPVLRSSSVPASLLACPALPCTDWCLPPHGLSVIGSGVGEWCSSPKYGLLADRYHFCEKCFNEIQGESVSLGDDPSQPQT